MKVGTIFEASHVPLRFWLQAMFLMASSKKGVSANQLHRTLGVTLKTAWFMAHRIREAMRDGSLAPFGHGGGIVEADETYIGREPGEPITNGGNHKLKVLSLVDRSSGAKRSFVLDFVNVKVIDPPSFQWTPMLAFRSWRGVSDECREAPDISGVVQARGG